MKIESKSSVYFLQQLKLKGTSLEKSVELGILLTYQLQLD